MHEGRFEGLISINSRCLCSEFADSQLMYYANPLCDNIYGKSRVYKVLRKLREGASLSESYWLLIIRGLFSGARLKGEVRGRGVILEFNCSCTQTHLNAITFLPPSVSYRLSSIVP